MSRADGTNPRAMGTNPRALGTSERKNRRVRKLIKREGWTPGEGPGDRILPKWLRFEVLKRNGFRCAYCGARACDGVWIQVDHIKPKALGGSDDPSNLTTACSPCNSGKSATPLNWSAI